MTDLPEEKNRINWNCARCNSVLLVEVGIKYGSCSTCGASFSFDWVDGKLERSLALNEITSSVKKEKSDEAIQVSNVDNKMNLRELNDKIRRLEMTKGGERIRALAVFVLICTIIYYLFTLTVHGIARVTSPELTDLIVVGIAAISLMIIVVYRLYRSTVVRKCNILIAQRNELEEHIKNLDVSINLPDSALTTEERQATNENASDDRADTNEEAQTRDTDIIEKFASRKKQRRSRLNIRDDS